jgi:tRNA1Val (adenine37-N6)-methyltransferase
MKVGTDGVLLGAWANVSNATRILDIGTGTGVIALILAQRTNSEVHIDAVEIDAEALADAKENIQASPWHVRLTVYCIAIQDFNTDHQFDHILTNPPYFIGSYKPPDNQRVVARHNDTLSFADIISTANRLLTPNGRLSIILPYTEGLTFMQTALEAGFHCTRQWNFKSRQEKPIERWLLEFSKGKRATETGELVLYKFSKGEEWSETYALLTRDFYLKL